MNEIATKMILEGNSNSSILNQIYL